MKPIRYIIAAAAFLVLCQVAGATIPVKGRVVDSNGDPLPGVFVLEEGVASNGVMTDDNGNYSMQVTDQNSVLLFSQLGFKELREPVGARKVFNVTLKDDTTLLEEVVVVGYGVQKKGSITGSIASINNETLTAAPTDNVSNMLGGKLPGLVSRQTSGLPGENDAQVYIRGISTTGNSSPLVLVDGVERSLNDIDPAEIESFSVLKDAFIVDMLLCLVNNILEEDLDALYDDCLTDIITTMPGVWSFVPDAYYENAKKALYSDTGDKYSALTKLTDGYHYGVQVGLGDRLKAEQKNGLAVCVSMGYAIAPIPVYDNCVDQTDMLIDTKYGSLGATCAPIGETLKADSTNKYLSSDLLVDASTCAFPDSTWFVRYQDHNDFCDAYNDFVYYLLTADGQPTVTSNAAFPQFMACDGHKVLVPAGALPEADTRPSIIRLGENTYKLIKELIESNKK